MKRQIEMEEAMLTAHREFLKGLENAVELLDKDIREAGDMAHTCTDEWCRTTESVLDELHKYVYSISEPRWLTEEDSKAISNLRRRLRDLYAEYKATGHRVAA